MIAETVYNIFIELPEKEKKRFCVMIGVSVPKKKKVNTRFPSDAEITEFLIQKFFKK